MASLVKNVFNNLTTKFKSLLSKPSCLENGLSVSLIPSRTKWIDHRMARDVKRRMVIKEYAQLRLNINSLRYNTILPKRLQEVADKEIHALPKDSCLTRSHPRCVLTSRARGRWRRFRMSRIIWRHLADYNQISGAERAMWSSGIIPWKDTRDKT